MSNLSLFPAIVVDAPATEGIKYAGSKLRLLPYILERLIRSTAARWIILSYSSGAALPPRTCTPSCTRTAELSTSWNWITGATYGEHEMDQRGLHDAGTPNREFLFLIDRG